MRSLLARFRNPIGADSPNWNVQMRNRIGTKRFLESLTDGQYQPAMKSVDETLSIFFSRWFNRLIRQ
jgi:hypothetical protein